MGSGSIWDKYKVDVPTGKSGNWCIERFEISEADSMVSRIRSRFSFSDRGRTPIVPGVYTKLSNEHTLVMSDTPAEIRDHLGFIYSAKGRVLICGLGIGMVTRACLFNSKVDKVTVVEISEDVINLVSPWLKGVASKAETELDIICDDAFTWKPEKEAKWDVSWYDVWNYISTDNYEGMKRLHRRFSKRCDYQASWCRKEVEKLIKRERDRDRDR